ncbi:hypothetical protein MESS2_1570055 [Mesorhizobium metallidurans STM 2683]|uniref:Uncharacterized protein n=1 Tax=Mesorhizobium metallidurans STM 2683 TaxID=1297569 RepID=M5EMR3_9HYPH|nr:hypothetical protein MESS2_1570055 [Mesorhizobium metallidurans STM 2683]
MKAAMGSVVDIACKFGGSLTNLVSRMGTGRDKASSSYYTLPIITDDQVLNAYRGAWLPRKIVDIPAFNSVRAWRDWQAEGVEIEPIFGSPSPREREKGTPRHGLHRLQRVAARGSSCNHHRPIAALSSRRTSSIGTSQGRIGSGTLPVARMTVLRIALSTRAPHPDSEKARRSCE